MMTYLKVLCFTVLFINTLFSFAQTNYASVKLKEGREVSGTLLADLSLKDGVVIRDDLGKTRRYDASEINEVILSNLRLKSKVYRDSTFLFKVIVESNVSLLKLGYEDFFIEMDSLFYLPKPTEKRVGGRSYENEPHLNHMAYLFSSSCVVGMINQHLDYNEKDLKDFILAHLECNESPIVYVSPNGKASSSFTILAGGQLSYLDFSYGQSKARVNDFSRYTESSTFSTSPYLGLEYLVRWDRTRLGLLISPIMKFSSFRSDFGEDRFYTSSFYSLHMLEAQLRIGLLYSLREKLSMSIGISSSFKVIESVKAGATTDMEEFNFDYLFIEDFYVFSTSAGPQARFEGHKELSGQFWSPTLFYELNYKINNTFGLNMLMSSNYGYHNMKVSEVYDSHKIVTSNLRSYRLEIGLGIIYYL